MIRASNSNQRWRAAVVGLSAVIGAAVLIALVLSLRLTAVAAPSETIWYVHPDGSDSDTGTLGMPLKTIQYAIDTAGNGDLILVAAGTYTENLVVSKSLTLRGGYVVSGTAWLPPGTAMLPGTETIIDGSGSQTTWGDWDNANINTSCVVSDSGVYKMWYQGWGVMGVWPGVIGYATSSDGISWTKPLTAPVLVGTSGMWDEQGVEQPHVIHKGGEYHMWYGGFRDGKGQIGYATSPDGITWTKTVTNPVLQPGSPGEWDELGIGGPFVVKASGVYTMWYQGEGNAGWGIGLATSPDGMHWTKYAGNPVLLPGAAGEWDEWFIGDANVVWDGMIYQIWYTGGLDGWKDLQVGYATSTDGVNWIKYGNNPVLGPGPDVWDEDSVTEPNVLLQGSTFKMWFSGSDGERGHKGYAWSNDGSTWIKYAGNPVLSTGALAQWGDPVVRFEDGSDGSVLEGFTITGGTGEDAGGVQVGNADITIRNCLIHDNFADGPNHWGGGGVLGGNLLTIVDSRIINNGVNRGAGGVRVGDGLLVMSNTLVADNYGDAGLHLNGGATLMNVTLVGNDGGVIHNPFVAVTLAVTNSIIYDNNWSISAEGAGTVQVAYSDVEGSWTGTGNIDADPQFVDAANGDYHLELGSPCIDAGTSVGAPAHDIEGNPRDANPDLGAYEWVGEQFHIFLPLVLRGA